MRTLLALFVIASLCRAADDSFAIRDGDTVVFLGDSITAARSYGKIIENYTLLRYPKRNVHFHNAGWGGDTAASGLARLERDVLSQGATLVTVAYGFNDIGWGMKADDEHKKIYLDAIRGIIEKCKQRNVRVIICSAAITSADPDKSENDYLQKMCDEGLALAKSLGAGTIDVQRSMRTIQRHVWAVNAKLPVEKRRDFLHLADGAHLTEPGQMAMAYAILKGMNAPADVSSASVDAKAASVLEATACRITNVKKTETGIEFDRLDEGLPIKFGALAALNFGHIPFPQELNRYMLTIKNLSPGRYSLTVEGRGVGTWPSTALEAGVNISSFTAKPWEPGGPWDAQANVVLRLTEARNGLELARMMSRLYAPQLDGAKEWSKDSDETNARLESLQRSAARPLTYHYVISPALEEKK